MMLAAAGLTVADFSTLGGMVGVPLTFVIFYLRSMRADARTFREEMRADAESIRMEMGKRWTAIEQRLLKVEDGKVNTKDWVRVTVAQQNRQDRMNAQLSELSGKLDATIGIAGGLKRIGDALHRKAESDHGSR